MMPIGLRTPRRFTVVIVGVLWRNADAIGRALLAVMEAFARLIGAL